MGPAVSRRIPRAPRYSGFVSRFLIRPCTGLSPPLAPLSRSFHSDDLLRFLDDPTTPTGPRRTPWVWALPRSLATTCGITFVFFSCGYLDVSVPRVRLPCGMVRLCSHRVAPFGHSGIKGYLHLPRTSRSLSRPSSPPRAMGIHRLPFPTFLPSSFGVSPSGLRILLDSLFVIFFVLLVQHVNDLFSSPCGACGE